MQEKDVVTMEYFEDPTKFADLMNGVLSEWKWQIQPEDIVVTVDLTGKEIGASTVKAHIAIKGDKYTAVGALGAHSVSVTLKEAEAE